MAFGLMPNRFLLLAVADWQQSLAFANIAEFASKFVDNHDSVRISYIDSELERVDICSESEFEEALQQPGHLTLLISNRCPAWKLHDSLIPFQQMMDSMLNGMELIGSAIEQSAEAACDAMSSICAFTAHLIDIAS